MKIRCATVLLFASLAFGQSAEKKMTNADVVELVKNGLSEDIIAADVQAATATDFDTSVDGLKQLQQAHVPVAVIKVMMAPRSPASAAASQFYAPASNDPNAPHHPGIYLYDPSNDKPTLTELQQETASEAKGSGALAHAFSYGIAKIKVKGLVEGSTAPVKTADTNPVFYLYYIEAPAMFGGGGMKPSDFTLLQFEQKKGNREITTMSSNILGSSSGTDDKAKRGFTFEQVKPGEYKIKLTAPLLPGEYAFRQSSAFFYTFSIQPKP